MKQETTALNKREPLPTMKDAPVQVLDRICKQNARLTNRVTHMEKKIQGVTDEFVELLDTLVEWNAWSHAAFLLPSTELTEVRNRTEKIIAKMRLKYG